MDVFRHDSGLRGHGLAHGLDVLFRGVRLEENANVRDCIIMQGTVIGEGADLECVILDKEVVVRPGAVLRGTKDHPLVFKRGEIV